jgi:hypothetical protein
MKYNFYLSFIGHSYGGILGRYAAGQLFADNFARIGQALPEGWSKRYQIVPLTYMSLSSPHLGVEHTYNSELERHVVRWVLAQFGSGKDLILLPGGWLDRLSDPHQHFMVGWKQFRSRMLIGAVDDELVRARTACALNKDLRKNIWEYIGKRGDLSSFGVLWHAGFDEGNEEQEEQGERMEAVALQQIDRNRRRPWDFYRPIFASSTTVRSDRTHPPHYDPTDYLFAPSASVDAEQLSLHDRMLFHLNEAGIRRIVLDLGCNGWLSGMATTHPLISGRYPSQRKHNETANLVATFFAQLLMADYQIAVSS